MSDPNAVTAPPQGTEEDTGTGTDDPGSQDGTQGAAPEGGEPDGSDENDGDEPSEG